ncbi:MAG: response regulator, partial [Lachnospiraceae bacterium]|nr:response regulator [Lachnospiraceae bacterium]
AEETGRALKAALSGIEDVKGVFLVASMGFFNIERAFEELDEERRRYPFFGTKSANGCFWSDEYMGFGADNDGVYDDVFFAVIFHGRDLQLRATYNFGWKPIGRKFTVTKTTSDILVDEIDGQDATNIYKGYLGLEEDQITALNICEFPLILRRGKRNLARIGLKGEVNGQLKFSVPVHEGDELRLSFGNPHDILSEILNDSRSYLSFNPEAMILVTCGNRMMLLGEDEHVESDFYRQYAPQLINLFGFSEILCDAEGGGELNSALVAVGMREGPAEEWALMNDEKSCRIQIKQREIPLLNRLLTFMDAMTRELEDMAIEANAASEAKSIFLSSMSHEIRTPINAILGLDEMIIRSTKEEVTKANALGIQNSGRNLLGLINDVLDVSRIESGRMEIIEVEYELGSVVNDLVNMIKVRTDEKQLEFKVEIDPETPHLLLGDEIRLKQCATNILTNAVKYTEEGSVTMKIGHRSLDNGNVMLSFSVRDTGIGIKKEDMDKLFKPFERIEEDRNRSIEGSGLGMNIVMNLLHMMGSELKVESVYGEGSEFSYEVEQRVVDPAPIGNFNEMYERSLETSAYQESFHAPEARVLVVDDTKMNLLVFKGLLENTQVQIDTADSGDEALVLYESTPYDVIFLDQRMPGMDGTQTLHAMRHTDNYINESTPIIVLTATVTSGAREAFIAAGFTDYLSKPIDSVKLERMLMEYIPKGKIVLPGDERFGKIGEGGYEGGFDSGSSYVNLGSETGGSTEAGVDVDHSYVNLSKLREVEGLDYGFALKNCMKESILLESAESFVQLGEESVKEIMDFFEKKDYKNYTIKVHALKSSARLIGLRALSEKAAYLEECGDSNNIAEIERLTPELVDSYVNYIETLSFLVPEEAGSEEADDKPEIDEASLKEAYGAIGELAEVLDYDGVRSVLDEIGNYGLSKDDADRMKKIAKALDGLESEEIIRLVKERG